MVHNVTGTYLIAQHVVVLYYAASQSELSRKITPEFNGN